MVRRRRPAHDEPCDDPDGVLEAIYTAAGVSAPVAEEAHHFAGTRCPSGRGAALVFYVVWPAMVLTAAILYWRRLA
jgi:hypothetical protein